MAGRAASPEATEPFTPARARLLVTKQHEKRLKLKENQVRAKSMKPEDTKVFSVMFASPSKDMDSLLREHAIDCKFMQEKWWTADVEGHGHHPCTRFNPPNNKRCQYGDSCTLSQIREDLCPQFLRKGYCDRLVMGRPCGFEAHAVMVAVGTEANAMIYLAPAKAGVTHLPSAPRTRDEARERARNVTQQRAAEAANGLQRKKKAVLAMEGFHMMMSAGAAAQAQLRQINVKRYRVEPAQANLHAWRGILPLAQQLDQATDRIISGLGARRTPAKKRDADAEHEA